MWLHVVMHSQMCPGGFTVRHLLCLMHEGKMDIHTQDRPGKGGGSHNCDYTRE